MSKLLYALLIPMVVFAGTSHFTSDCEFQKDVTIGDSSADTLTINATTVQVAAASFPDGTALLPSINNTGDLNTGLWFSAADTINASCGGVEQLEIDATSLDIVPDTNITGALDVDGDTDMDDVTISGVTDIPAGAVGAPSLVITGSATTGFYQTAADEIAVAVGGANVTTWDSTGIIATGINGPIGTTTPAQGEFTNIYGSGDFYYGQTPPDLFTGYKNRSDYITFSDTFTYGNDTTYAANWDVTGVTGAGTNTVTVRDGWSELVTGGAGGPDMESTVSNGLTNYRAYLPRLECVTELTAASGQVFSFGFYAAANEYVEIMADSGTGVNWYLIVDDTAGAETIDSGVAVTTDPTKLEIAVAADGTVTWAIDDVAMTVVGLTNQMTANAHYTRWIITDIAAAVHTVAVDYVELEQLKQQ